MGTVLSAYHQQMGKVHSQMVNSGSDANLCAKVFDFLFYPRT